MHASPIPSSQRKENHLLHHLPQSLIVPLLRSLRKIQIKVEIPYWQVKHRDAARPQDVEHQQAGYSAVPVDERIPFAFVVNEWKIPILHKKFRKSKLLVRFVAGTRGENDGIAGTKKIKKAA